MKALNISAAVCDGGIIGGIIGSDYRDGYREENTGILGKPIARACASARETKAPTLADRLLYFTRSIGNPEILSDAEYAVEKMMKELACPSGFHASELYHCLKIGFNSYDDLLELVKRVIAKHEIRNPSGYFFKLMQSVEKYKQLGRIRYRDLPSYVSEHFYDESVFCEIEAAVEDALKETSGKEEYRDSWILMCLKLGLSKFQDRLHQALSTNRQGEVRKTAGFLYTLMINDTKPKP